MIYTYLNCFLLLCSVFLKDEKNQLMTTNVWLWQVKAIYTILFAVHSLST